MILLLDTSDYICKMYLDDGNWSKNYEWQADRQLAKRLFFELTKFINSCDKKWSDITAIGVFMGPGSFTGLRIGLTVANTIADSEKIPIVGAVGDDWKNEAILKINNKIDEKIILPFYGSEARITAPKK